MREIDESQVSQLEHAYNTLKKIAEGAANPQELSKEVLDWQDVVSFEEGQALLLGDDCPYR